MVGGMTPTLTLIDGGHETTLLFHEGVELPESPAFSTSSATAGRSIAS
jgi:hypothetical protein